MKVINFNNHKFKISKEGILFWFDKQIAIIADLHLEKGSSFKEIEDFVKNICNIEEFGKIEVEKFREKWALKDKCHEIVFDIWPGLPEYMEVDCGTKR